MSELCRLRRSEGYGVCDDVEAKVYKARRSDTPSSYGISFRSVSSDRSSSSFVRFSLR